MNPGEKECNVDYEDGKYCQSTEVMDNYISKCLKDARKCEYHKVDCPYTKAVCNKEKGVCEGVKE